MIRIERTGIAPPPELLGAAEREAEKARDFYSDPNNLRYGKPFRHQAYRAKGVRESLLELFYDKCAFCESKLGVSSTLDIGLFRPTAMAVNHDGSISKPGYWWLAWEWSNLYPACPLCNRTKANRFPIVGRRAEFVEAGSERQVITAADAPLRSVASTAGGEVAITASLDGRLDYWDLKTGRTRFSTEVGAGIPSDVAATSDGSTVVVASRDGPLMVVRLSQRFSVLEDRFLPVSRDRLQVQAVAISPDGRLVISASGESLRVWDVQKGVEVHRLEGHTDRVNAMAVTPDGCRVISAAEEGTLGVWDLETGEELDVMVGDVVMVGVGVAADGLRAVSLSGRGTLQVWDLETGKECFKIEGDGHSYDSLALSADGRFAACKRDQAVRVVDLHIRRERVSIRQSSAQFNDAAVTPHGHYILTAGEDGALRVWNLYTVGGERALLLDPCHVEPADYLVFSQDGLVASVPPDSDSSKALDGERFKGLDRGQMTIDAFGLNRAELVEERRRAAKQLRKEVQEAVMADGVSVLAFYENAQARMDELLSSRHPYAAMRRQLLPKYVEEITAKLLTEESVLMPESVEEKIVQYAVEGDVYAKAFANLETVTGQRMATTIEDVEKSEVFLRSALISRVEIENFRCIEDLSFNFIGGSENRVSWKVLLGENGVGKSSVLEAVALAVMGKKRLENLTDIDPTSLLKRGTDKGCVRVYFSTDTRPIELELTPEGPVYPSSESALRTYLFGFGSARWLPRKGAAAPETDPYVRVRNLLNPFVPLTDAIKWLTHLKKKREIKNYQKVEAVLARLLQLEPETRLPLRKGVIYVQRPGVSVNQSERLDQLSDGYQTVLAIAVAIMDMLGKLWDMEMEAAEGLVLLDEIGAHLHPRWKLRIVESLRSAFPRIQFLAATHEPLCLRGLFDNEILLLRRIAGQIRATDNIESPDTLTVDQLLRSPLFGMLTTFDPDTERDFERYYAILSKPESKRESYQTELEQLRQRLGQRGVLAEMARRQVVSQVMHEQLEAQVPEEERLDPQVLKNETKDLIVGLWDEVYQEEAGE